jgi:serine/threonine protein kinase
MPNRSLDRILFRRPENMGSSSSPLCWERRRNIVGGLAAALFYLHEQLETQIIHRDVKTSNVMLNSHYNWDVKLLQAGDNRLQDGSYRLSDMER